MKTKAMTFFKIGAWILTLAGFAHAAIALPDAWMHGAFSPASDDLITVMKTAPVNIVDFMHGSGTSIIGGTVWGAYTGFAIAVGLLTGFLGLIMVIMLGRETVMDNQRRKILTVAVVMSALMMVIAALFYFWFPLMIFAAVLVCFVLAWFSRRKEVYHAAR
jgi:hypothetical protein